jgi:hypothetical protein
MMLSPSGRHFSPRYYEFEAGRVTHKYSADSWTSQALQGKDVKDLLLNVGSGGGAAAAPTAGGAAAGGAAVVEEKKEEPKDERMIYPIFQRSFFQLLY